VGRRYAAERFHDRHLCGRAECDALIIYDGSTTGDIKVQIVGPTGTSFLDHKLGIITTATANTGSAAFAATAGGAQAAGAIGAGSELALRARGLVVIGATAGTVKLQFAQNTSDATHATTVYANSFLKAQRQA
jgi:hypothetical protein